MFYRSVCGFDVLCLLSLYHHLKGINTGYTYLAINDRMDAVYENSD